MPIIDNNNNNQHPTKYLGRHNRDRTVGLYVQDKTVYECEREAVVTPLRGIIQTVMPGVRIGLLAKVVGGPAGLGFGVPSGVVWGCQCTVGEDSKFFKFHPTADLQDGYLAFELTSPAHLIPSLPLAGQRSASKATAACLKWYLYAEEPVSRSRVFLSLNRVWVADPARVRSVAASAGRASRGHLTLSARLDSSCYYSGDTVTATVVLDKPTRFKFHGFRLTVKQLLDVSVVDTTNSSRSTSWTIKKNLHRLEYNTDWYKQVRGESPAEHYADMERVQEQLDIVLDPSELKVEAFVEPGAEATLLAPSFDTLALLPSGSRRLCCTLHYYLNVHVILPWSANLIVSLPFSIASSGRPVAGVDEPKGPKTRATESVLEMPVRTEPSLPELPLLDDVQQALELLDQLELHRQTRHRSRFEARGADACLSGLHNVALSFMCRDIDPLAGQGSILSRHARMLVQHCARLASPDLNDAVRLLLNRLQDGRVGRDRLEDAVNRISGLLPKA